MIKSKVTFSGLEFVSTVYNQWDVEEHEIVEWKTLTSKDNGKYVMFDDGSELYTKIIHVGAGTISSECGTYVIGDIIHCYQPKYKNSNYAGVFSKDLSLQVLPLKRQEKSIVVRASNGERMRSLTPRLEEGISNVFRETLTELGYDPNEIAKKSVEKIIEIALSEKHSPQSLKANENLQRMLNDVDITKLESTASKAKKSLGAIENASFTISEDDSNEANKLLEEIRNK